MLETLEARLAARSEAFFPELRPALPTGPRSLPPHLRSTKPNPSATVHRSSSSKLPEKASSSSKAINLPSSKKVNIHMDHIASGHESGGWRTKCKGANKTLFPEGFSRPQLEKIIQQAYKNCKKIRTRGDRVVVVGEYNGIKIKMHVNLETKTIETAYPTK